MSDFNGTVTKITSDKDEYINKANDLINSINNINSTIKDIIDTEMHRLLGPSDKEFAAESDRNMKKNINKMSQEQFFKVATKSGAHLDAYQEILTNDPAHAETLAKSAMKAGKLERPSTIDLKTWEGYSIEKKKNAYYTYLESSAEPENQQKLKELVFDGMKYEEKKEMLEGQYEKYIESLSVEEKLELIARYSEKEKSESNEQTFTQSLEVAQEDLDSKRKTLESECNQLINSMKNVISINDMNIETLRQTVTMARQNLESACHNAYNTYLASNPPSPILKEKEYIETRYSSEQEYEILKAQVDSATENLQDAIEAQNEAVTALKEKIEELDRYGIELNKKRNTDTSRSDNQGNSLNNSGTSNSKLSQKEKADNAFYNMFGKYKEGGEANAEDIKNMLHNESYEKLVSQAMQQKGILKRIRLKSFYGKFMWNELVSKAKKDGIYQGIEDILQAEDVGIELEDLKKFRNLNVEQLTKINNLLTGYKSKTVIQQEQLDSLMDFIKLGLLIKQTNYRKTLSNKKRDLIKNILNTSEKRAIGYHSRESKIINKTNKWLETIKTPHLKRTMPSTPPIVTEQKIDHEL